MQLQSKQFLNPTLIVAVHCEALSRPPAVGLLRLPTPELAGEESEAGAFPSRSDQAVWFASGSGSARGSFLQSTAWQRCLGWWALGQTLQARTIRVVTSSRACSFRIFIGSQL